MNRRRFLASVLASFAAATALARTRLEVVRPVEWVAPEPWLLHTGNTNGETGCLMIGPDSFHIGTAANHVTWDGETLRIRGVTHEEMYGAR